MDYTEIRWQQRFQNFEKSLIVLERIANIKSPNEAERMGMIQAFEICFELAWKTAKDYLKSKGYDVKNPRDTIKQATQEGLMNDGRIWLEALDARNQSTHLYDEAQIGKTVEQIQKDYLLVIKFFYDYLKGRYNK